jgi:hypothetical protein
MSDWNTITIPRRRDHAMGYMLGYASCFDKAGKAMKIVAGMSRE